MPNRNFSSHIRPRTVFLGVLAVFAVLLVGFRGTASRTRGADRLRFLPPTIVWAWERPEDLRFLDPKKTGVAFLWKTVFLDRHSVSTVPRMQPLRVPPGTPLIAVIRVEARQPDLNDEQRRQTVDAITSATTLTNIQAVQVDFDATVSQREFYRASLSDVRRRLPPDFPLLITALASWCMNDDWITGLDIDEAVPMLFRMGQNAHSANAFLASNLQFKSPHCQGSLGLSSDEPAPLKPGARRLYLFHPRAWTAAAYDRALHEVSQ